MRTEQTAVSGNQRRYINGIDGLRAFAVVAVLAYHLQLPFSKGGLLGVTVFFVISGFLITRILLTEIDTSGTIDLKNFWIRRIRRLLPAILTMVTALIFVSAVFNRVLFTKACSDLLSSIFCYNNWWQIFNDVSYFQNAGAPSPLTHCWSLAIEAQFYLVYPLILMVLARFMNRQKVFLGVSAALAVISAALMWILFDPTQDPSRVYYGTDTRVFSLLFGSVLAIVTQREGDLPTIPSVARDGIGTAALIGLLCMMGLIDGYSSFLYRGGQILASFLSMLVVFAVLDPQSILGKLLGLPPFKWIGDRSYSIYLWHYPIILLISGGKKSSWWIILIETALTVLFSALSYRFVETPVRHGIIGKSIATVTSHPRTRRERRRAVLLLKRMIKISAAVCAVALAAVLCLIFVPRETALSNIDELEAQAAKADKIRQEKIDQIAEAGSGSQEGEDASSDSTDGTSDGTDGASGGTDGASTVAQTDEELLSSLQLLLIGDSVSLGATEEFYEVFSNSISDAAVSRFPWDSDEIYDTYSNEHGWNGDGVIFALGANGLLNDSVKDLREKMGPDKKLFLVTAHAPYTSWVDTVNQEMREYAETLDNVYLADWNAASEGHSEYFGNDETHLTRSGADAYVACIREAVLEAYGDT